MLLRNRQVDGPSPGGPRVPRGRVSQAPGQILSGVHEEFGPDGRRIALEYLGCLAGTVITLRQKEQRAVKPVYWNRVGRASGQDVRTVGVG